MPDKILQEKNATCSGVNYSQIPLIPSSGTNQKVNAPEKRNVCMPLYRNQWKRLLGYCSDNCHGKLVVQNKLYQGYQHGLNNQKITSNRQY